MRIHLRTAGLLTTVQDLGRFGYAHVGMSPAGAADARSFRLANLLVGNDENAPALEMTLLGATLEFESSAWISVTGAKVSGEPGIPMWQAVQVPAGSVLNCGTLSDGARSYLAVQGGFKVEKEIHSASTDLGAGIGGLGGRALRNGDVLETEDVKRGSTRTLRPGFRGLGHGNDPVRVTTGVQWEWFAEEMQKSFLSATYMVSQQSNRAGLRLSGKEIFPRNHSQLLTEGVPLGAIQIPPNGHPIILFVDQQTTGGYPKIANVIAADLHRIGQLRPDDPVHFELVGIEQAVTLLRAQEKMLREAFLP